MRLDLTRSERFFLILAAILITIPVTLYLTEIKIYSWWTGIHDEAHSLKQVGTIQKLTGTVKRQSYQMSVAEKLKGQEILYGNDLIVTEPASTTTLKLNRGAEIILGENTMILLDIKHQVGLEEISQGLVVQVLSGTVKATTQDQPLVLKSMSHAPTVLGSHQEQTLSVPTGVQYSKMQESAAKQEVAAGARMMILQPAQDSEWVANLKATVNPTVNPTVNSTDCSAATQVRIVLALEKEDWNRIHQQGEVVVKFDLRQGKKTLKSWENKLESYALNSSVEVHSPGQYNLDVSYKIAKNSYEKATSTQFLVLPEVLALKSFTPKIVANYKSFYVVYTWDRHSCAGAYRVKHRDKDSQSYHITQLTSKNEAILYEGHPFWGTLQMRVEAPTKNGFVLVSPWVEVTSYENKPILTSPVRGQVIKIDQSVLLAWSKMYSAQEYWVEVALDESFQQIVFSHKTTKNFILFEPKNETRFYWRVYAVSAKLKAKIVSETGHFDIHRH